jgi:ELWxxDGT repeat protein
MFTRATFPSVLLGEVPGVIHQIVRAALAGALLISFGHVFATDCRVDAVTAILDSRSIKQLGCTMELNGQLYFTAQEVTTGTELWTSDGTSMGTLIVKDIVPGAAGSQPANLTVVNGRLYFQATDLLYGTELWESDGTRAGTQIAADIMPGPLGSYPGMPVSDGVRTLYFPANDAEHGREVWAFDTGTQQARLIRDVWEGPGGSYPSYLTMYRGMLFFGATDVAHGSELWRSDGTAGGTALLADLIPGPFGAQPYDVSVLDGRLHFDTFDAQSGVRFFTSNGVLGDVVALGADPYNTRATLSWTAPTENLDQTPLTDLLGYAVYHWTDADPIPFRAVDISDAAMTSYVFTDLAPGTHYFAVIAISRTGGDSPRSSTAMKTVQ